jgi:hypothetical protein
MISLALLAKGLVYLLKSIVKDIPVIRLWASPGSTARAIQPNKTGAAGGAEL